MKQIAQVGLSWSSSGPDSTDHTHPYRTGDRKTCPCQTSKKLKFRCRPSTRQEPTTIDTNIQVGDRKRSGEAIEGLRSLRKSLLKSSHASEMPLALLLACQSLDRGCQYDMQKFAQPFLCKFIQVREARLQKANAHDARHVHDCSHQCSNA